MSNSFEIPNNLNRLYRLVLPGLLEIQRVVFCKIFTMGCIVHPHITITHNTKIRMNI